MDTRMKETDTEAEIREMFKVLDMDGNGFISAEEFKWTMMNLGNQLTEEETLNIEANRERGEVEVLSQYTYQAFKVIGIKTS
ncbi:hypothetical protein pdam_00016572 [Pocillopora damicornis]|uniref:EF-hand domain-containing protein n=1 Tax=Pocillopora damicornis TaxID=46731 RepID=A0A3M6TGY2_POCDA|nr:hypothetical protein pdam_00016572 [Pocillopora damicornis]